MTAFTKTLLVTLLAVWSAMAPAEAAGSRWGKGYLPNIPVVTQDGKTINFYDDAIKDRIVVISFIYTSCRDICPLVTARLSQIYDKLGDAAGRDIKFVSISIDPVNDTPEKLKQHADAFTADSRWLFLTGTEANIGAVRYKLGERSRRLAEHTAQIMMYNDRTGEWLRDSAFSDTGVIAQTIRSLDPALQLPLDVAAMSSHTTATPEIPGQAMFVKACASCHTVGQGQRIGPDLKDLSSRRDRTWALQYIQSPEQLRARHDPEALTLKARFPAVRMPNLQVSEADASDLLSYIETRSLAASKTKAEVNSTATITPSPATHRH